MRKSDMVSAETALQIVQDQARLISARKQVVSATMEPIKVRLRNNHIDREFSEIAKELT